MFMKHRKEYHSDKVPSCNSVNTGSWRYGENKCWFKHSKNENNINDSEENMDFTETDKNSEMLQKLFEMVEKYTNKINLLENEIKELKSEIWSNSDKWDTVKVQIDNNL